MILLENDIRKMNTQGGYSWPTRAMAEKESSSIRLTWPMMATPASFTRVWGVVGPSGRGKGARESAKGWIGKTRSQQESPLGNPEKINRKLTNFIKGSILADIADKVQRDSVRLLGPSSPGGLSMCRSQRAVYIKPRLTINFVIYTFLKEFWTALLVRQLGRL